ncbi:MAG: hypothetical protein AB8F95_01545 [Bacteroidia bacterium]
MKKNILAWILMPLCLVFACKSTKNIDPSTFEGRQMRFGSGGGYTGAVTQWALLDNGRLWGVSGEPTAALQAVGKISKKTMKALFAAADSLDWDGAPNEPGNMYRFLELHSPEGVTKMVWDTSQKERFATLDAFYDRLKPIMKAQGPAPTAAETTSPDE